MMINVISTVMNGAAVGSMNPTEVAGNQDLISSFKINLTIINFRCVKIYSWWKKTVTKNLTRHGPGAEHEPYNWGAEINLSYLLSCKGCQ